MLTLVSLSKFVEKFKSRKTRTRRTRGQKMNLPLEALETRLMPAATIVGLPGAGTARIFTDADGDTVTVRVSGSSGTATFTDAGAGSVGNGDNIAGVKITGASSDFTLTYSFDASGGGTNTVLMGDISATTSIKGVFTVPLNDAPNPAIGVFTLGSFIGPGFSLHGGLSADNVVGNVSDVGIDIKGSLGATNTINFRGNVDADMRIRGALNGIIAFGNGVTATSDLKVDGSVGKSGQIGGVGDFLGTATFGGTFSGTVTMVDDAEGNWTFNSAVLSSARLLADGWFDVNALSSFGGQLVAYESDLDLSVAGNVTGTANIVVDDGDIVMDVKGSVLSGARISGGSDVSIAVGGSLSANIAASDSLTLDVVGAITNSVLAAYSDIELNVGRGISGTKLTGSDITIDVKAGGITNSKLTASSNFDVTVTGSVTGTQMTSGSGDSTLDISGSLVNSQISSGSENLTLNVGGSIVDSHVQSDESGITVDVKGSVTRSTLAAASTSNITVTGNISFSTLLALDTDMTVTVGGNVSNSLINGSDITLDITGSLTNSSVTADEGSDLEITTGLDVIGCSITADDTGITLDVGRDLIRTDVSSTSDVTVTVGRNMTSSHLTSQYEDVTLDVTGNMTNSSAIATSSDITATVGGNFVTSSLTAYSDVSLDVTGSASGTITSYSSDITLDVGGTFKGTVIAADDLVADLGTLNGSLTSGEDLDLLVNGNVSLTSVIQALNVTAFQVKGNFAGDLTAINFDSNEGAINDLVLGNVTSTADINIGLFNGTAGETYRFGGTFLGHLAIAQSLDVNLTFASTVHSIVIGGSVGVTVVPTITIGGKLDFLSSNSLFDSTGSGDGDFEDGSGATTGKLITAGFTTVTPVV